LRRAIRGAEQRNNCHVVEILKFPKFQFRQEIDNDLVRTVTSFLEWWREW